MTKSETFDRHERAPTKGSRLESIYSGIMDALQTGRFFMKMGLDVSGSTWSLSREKELIKKGQKYNYETKTKKGRQV